jgi:hypothetical protein
MPNAYHCNFIDPSGGIFSTQVIQADTLGQAIDSCEYRVKSEAKTSGCTGFEIWQEGKRLHRG